MLVLGAGVKFIILAPFELARSRNTPLIVSLHDTTTVATISRMKRMNPTQELHGCGMN